MTDPLGLVFGALADPTRRVMLDVLLRDGMTSVPVLTAELPITRQAIAKHLAVLDDAGLIQRSAAAGREVKYQLCPGALEPATNWLTATDAAWERRLDRLKSVVERG